VEQRSSRLGGGAQSLDLDETFPRPRSRWRWPAILDTMEDASGLRRALDSTELCSGHRGYALLLTARPFRNEASVQLNAATARSGLTMTTTTCHHLYCARR